MVLDALVEFAKSESATVVNVRYADLMDDAVVTVRSIYDRLQMNAPEGLEELIIGYLRAQRSGKRAAPPKSLEAFGYRADAVWRDPAVIQYCDLFGVERELSRMIDTITGS
jgi:hypothetical protein